MLVEILRFNLQTNEKVHFIYLFDKHLDIVSTFCHNEAMHLWNVLKDNFKNRYYKKNKLKIHVIYD